MATPEDRKATTAAVVSHRSAVDRTSSEPCQGSLRQLHLQIDRPVVLDGDAPGFHFRFIGRLPYSPFMPGNGHLRLPIRSIQSQHRLAHVIVRRMVNVDLIHVLHVMLSYPLLLAPDVFLHVHTIVGEMNLCLSPSVSNDTVGMHRKRSFTSEHLEVKGEGC